MGTLRHRKGDEPITIRSLIEIAERKGWSLDMPLAYMDSETCDYWLARGVTTAGVTMGDVQLLELDFHPEEDWISDDAEVEWEV